MKYEVYQKNLLFRIQIINKKPILFGDRKALELNEVGEFIWNCFDGKICIQEICEKVKENFSANDINIYNDVENFVIQLLEHHTIFKI